MFRKGDKVEYINTPDTQVNKYSKGSKGECVSDEYQIQDWTFVNVCFGASYEWHPINVENLRDRDLTKRFDLID